MSETSFAQRLRRFRPTGLAVSILFLAFLHLPVFAEEIVNPKLEDTVPGRPGVTYLDLARLIAPDLAAAAYGYEGHQMKGMRSIADDPDPYTPTDFSITWLSAVPFRSEARDELLVLFDVSTTGPDAEYFAPLVLYDISGSPKIVDAADVAYDRDTSFRDTNSLSVGRDANVVVVSSTHGNAGQFYVQSPVILAKDGRLSLIDTVSTFNDLGCGFERTQALTLQTGTETGTPFRPLRATVTELTERTDEICEGSDVPPAGSRKFEVTYRWNVVDGRYVTDSDAFDRLAKENEARF